MDINVKVRRFDPEAESPKPFWQEYPVTMDDSATVLDTLLAIREQDDESLALRCSCRSAICGSCAMRINGHAALACKTKMNAVAEDGGTVTVEPMGNQPIVRDLVVDISGFYSKVRAVQPWLQPDGPEPERERLASNEQMLHLSGVMDCIMCGACYSDCTVLEVNPKFLGPAALAKAYRFVADPRDAANQSRLASYNKPDGIWDCARCMECAQVCPKGVAPMNRIMALREATVEAGFHNTNGARHSEVFERSVAHTGWLNELELPIRTVGIFNIPKLLGFVPVGIMSAYKRKLPPIMHKPIPGVENVRRLYKRVKDKQAAAR